VICAPRLRAIIEQFLVSLTIASNASTKRPNASYCSLVFALYDPKSLIGIVGWMIIGYRLIFGRASER
jgi:hypothetical protein